MNEKELQAKIVKEFGLDEAMITVVNTNKEANNKEFDKWLNNLIKRNGTTKY